MFDLIPLFVLKMKHSLKREIFLFSKKLITVVFPYLTILDFELEPNLTASATGQSLTYLPMTVYR
ncbi:hypothetical protein PMEGAPL125_01260 [Priestia megaterium]